jgi:hypothetical protein
MKKLRIRTIREMVYERDTEEYENPENAITTSNNHGRTKASSETTRQFISVGKLKSTVSSRQRCDVIATGLFFDCGAMAKESRIDLTKEFEKYNMLKMF